MSNNQDPYMSNPTRVPLNAPEDAQIVDAAVNNKGQQSILSEDTLKGLAALQQAVAANISEDKAKAVEPESTKVEEAAETDNSVSHPSMDDIVNNYYYTNSKVDNIHVRKSIESRLEDFDLDEVLFSDTLTQEVPILSKGKLTVVYRSIRKSDSNWIDTQAMTKYTNRVEQGNFIQDARLTFQVVAIKTSKRSVSLPEICNDPKAPEKIDSAMFEKKLAVIRGLKENLIVLLTLNMNWFNDRVDSAPMGDLLGNI